MVKTLKVCQGVGCTSRGSKNLMMKLKEGLHLEEESCNDEYCLDYCGCTSHCDKGINVRVNDKIAHGVTNNNWQTKIENPVEIIKHEVLIELEDDFLGDI